MRSLLPPPPKSGLKIKPWLVKLYYYCRSLEVSGDSKFLLWNESPTGTVLRFRPEEPAASGGLSPSVESPVIYSGDAGSGSYTADYQKGDIHKITAPSGGLSVMVSNVPLGCSLLLRIDNFAGSTVTWNGQELIGDDEKNGYVLTFANLIGTIKLYARLLES